MWSASEPVPRDQARSDHPGRMLPERVVGCSWNGRSDGPNRWSDHRGARSKGGYRRHRGRRSPHRSAGRHVQHPDRYLLCGSSRRRFPAAPCSGAGRPIDHLVDPHRFAEPRIPRYAAIASPAEIAKTSGLWVLWHGVVQPAGGAIPSWAISAQWPSRTALCYLNPVSTEPAAAHHCRSTIRPPCGSDLSHPSTEPERFGGTP